MLKSKPSGAQKPNYERISDHCSNIGLGLIETQSDEFDPHAYITSLKEVRHHSFDLYHEAYTHRYALPVEQECKCD